MWHAGVYKTFLFVYLWGSVPGGLWSGVRAHCRLSRTGPPSSSATLAQSTLPSWLLSLRLQQRSFFSSFLCLVAVSRADSAPHLQRWSGGAQTKPPHQQQSSLGAHVRVLPNPKNNRRYQANMKAQEKKLLLFHVQNTLIPKHRISQDREIARLQTETDRSQNRTTACCLFYSTSQRRRSESC